MRKHIAPYTVGIDEAGRGPLAGPVSVGAVRIPHDFDKKFFKGIRDSKQLTETQREMWYARAAEARKDGRLGFAVSLVSERIIDSRGISQAIRLGIRRCLKKLEAEGGECAVFLDGGLKAPEAFLSQKAVIKGDEKIAVISLASVAAKVTRDRYMKRLAEKHPAYGFEVHKGYGTKAHMAAIREHGVSAVHRKSFLKGV